MEKREFLLTALNSFSQNLLAVDYSQRDTLFFLLITYALDCLKGTRGTILKYEKQSNILYNQKTILYKNNISMYFH